MLKTFEQFVKCDSYPVLVEIITQYKARNIAILSEQKTKRLTAVFHLLDAHVFAKVGQVELECKSLLAFVREAYAHIETAELAKIIFYVFTKSMFAIMIYQYKDSH